MKPKMSRPLFYLLSFTWGLPMTLIGALTSAVLLIMGCRPKMWGYCPCFEMGRGWGGITLGMFIIVAKESSTYIKSHEHGHALQNCYFGFLMPFTVAIPSVTRYWYRELRYHRRGKHPKRGYYDIWFENSASKMGMELCDRLIEIKMI